MKPRDWIVMGGIACAFAMHAPASAQSDANHPANDVESILDRLEKRGETVTDLSCGLTWTIEDRRVFETTRKEGTLKFRRGAPNSVFRIEFDRLRDSDGTIKEHKEIHVFDGRHYIEAQAFSKTVVRREIVREGESVDPFELGSGPFPLPFGQKKQTILKHFAVETVPSTPSDPPNSDHLKCVPKPDSHLSDEYKELHFYVDRGRELPVRISANMKKDGKIITVDFQKLAINTGLAGSRLELHRDDIPPEWEWQDEAALPPNSNQGAGRD